MKPSETLPGRRSILSLDGLIKRAGERKYLKPAEVTRARREIVAERFAALYIGNGMDEGAAYRALRKEFENVPTGGAKRPETARRTRSSREIGNYRRKTRIARWFTLAIPYLRNLLAEERDRAGATIQVAYQYLAAVISTSPTTFIKVNKKTGRMVFNPFQAHITDLQRSVISKVSIDPETGRITSVDTPDPSRAIAQLIGLMKIESVKGSQSDGRDLKTQITLRFNAARLTRERNTESNKLALIELKRANA
jgi:hypothetical protein